LYFIFSLFSISALPTTVGYMVRWRFQSTYLSSYKLIFIKEEKFHKPLSRQ